MRSYDVKALFKKLSEGTISKEEMAYLTEWMNTSQEEGLADLMDKDWAEFREEEKLSSPPKWMSESETDAARVLRVNWRRRWAIAASVLMLVVSAIGIAEILSGKEPRLITESNTHYRKRLLSLPDGSKVWLKRHSTLSYWKPFKGSERSLELDGEAFFEVATDSLRPFIVRAGDLNTTVLGTSFNVISGKGAKLPEVALVEGAVRVSLREDTLKPGVILNPGWKANLDTVNRELITSSFIEDAPYAWTDDVIYFQKADVYEVARTLEAWYNIKFTIEQDSLITGTLVYRFDTRKLSVDEVLSGITSVMPYRFDRQENGTILIKPKQID